MTSDEGGYSVSANEDTEEDLSNIIPSSESDPPPPVTCHVIPCNSMDLCEIEESEMSNGGVEGLNMIVDTSSAVSVDSSNCESVQQSAQRTFTQADDFQDLSKGDDETSSRYLVQYSQEPIEQSIYRLGMINPNAVLTAEHTGHTVDPSIDAFASLSDLPAMSQLENVNRIYCNGQSSPDQFHQQRVSIPLPLSLLRTSGHTATLATTPTTALLNNGRNSTAEKVYRSIRASEPVPSSKSKTRMEEDPIVGFGPNEDASAGIVDLSNASAAGNLNRVSHLDSSNGAIFVSPTTDAVAAHDVILNSSVRSSPKQSLTGLDKECFCIHLCVTTMHVGGQPATQLPLFMDGFTCQTTLDPNQSYRLLTCESNRLFARLNEFIYRHVHPNMASSSELESQLPADGTEPHTSLDGNMRPVNGKPMIIQSARTSSSSSDLFFPKTHRLLIKRVPNRVFPYRGSSSTSPSTSVPVVRKVRPASRKRPPVARLLTSPSGPDSSPRVTTTSSSVGTDTVLTDVKTTFTDSRYVGGEEGSFEANPSFNSPVPKTMGSIFKAALDAADEVGIVEDEKKTHSTYIPVSPLASEQAPNYPSESGATVVNKPMEENLLNPSPLDTPLTGRIPVYGKWNSEPYYYAGSIELPQSSYKRLVQFEDGSKARLKPQDILFINLLPVNSEVFADWLNRGEYWADCVVTEHLIDSRRPYKIFCRTNGEYKALHRKDVAINQSQVALLRSKGVLKSATELTKAVIKADIIEEEQQDSKLSTPDVSLANVVYTKRQSKTKRYRSSWVTPITRLQSAESSSHNSCPLSASNSNRAVPSADPLSSSAKTLKREPKKATSPAVSNRKKQRLNGGFSQSPEISLYAIGEAEEATTPQKRTIIPELLSPPTHRTANESDTNLVLRRSLSRSLAIPTPDPHVFSGWSIMLTGYNGISQSSARYDRELLENLITACGGRILIQLLPTDPNMKHIEMGNVTGFQHFALVAPSFCRTLKYIQGLATLGRVPMLCTDWLLDSCRSAATTVLSDENIEPDGHINWPLRLLLSRPGQYELPRGFSALEKININYMAVPMHYGSVACRSQPALSLSEVVVDWSNGLTKCEIIAILTDDYDVFGQSWSDVLQLAKGASIFGQETRLWNRHEPKRTPIFVFKEAVEKLTRVLSATHGTTTTYPSTPVTYLVLVDLEGLTIDVLEDIKRLSVHLVTCDYLIQSLIVGHYLDFKDFSSFTPPQF